MTLKDILTKTNNWLREHRLWSTTAYQPQLDDQGLITPQQEPQPQATAEPNQHPAEKVNLPAKPIAQNDKNQTLERLQDGFNTLIEKLQGINDHLDRQVTQQEGLTTRMDKLPELLESFPSVVQNQKQLTEQLIEQLKTATTKDQQFIETVEKIPTETAKQTDALVNIDHQLAAAADTDVQMTESFNKFNQTLEKLDQTTLSQTDGIMQMSKTFATSDRYLKYLMSIQNKRFMWMFVTTIGVCVLAILILTAIIIYIKQ